MNKISFENNLWEKNKNAFQGVLKKWFPNMSKSVIEKNTAFLELLEEYREDNINGISTFLEKHHYDLKALKYISEGQVISIDPELSHKITEGVYVLGNKQFFETKKGIEYLYYYIIIAQKKNKWGIQGVKDALRDLLNPDTQESMS